MYKHALIDADCFDIVIHELVIARLSFADLLYLKHVCACYGTYRYFKKLNYVFSPLFFFSSKLYAFSNYICNCFVRFWGYDRNRSFMLQFCVYMAVFAAWNTDTRKDHRYKQNLVVRIKSLSTSLLEMSWKEFLSIYF